MSDLYKLLYLLPFTLIEACALYIVDKWEMHKLCEDIKVKQIFNLNDYVETQKSIHSKQKLIKIAFLIFYFIAVANITKYIF